MYVLVFVDSLFFILLIIRSDIDNQDLGSIPDLPVEEVGPQPQPAVITTTINDKVWASCMCKCICT